MVRVFPDADSSEGGVDSLDHLLIETYAGGMISCLTFFLFIAYMSSVRKGSGDFVQSALRLLVPLFDGFTQCRDALFRLFPDAGVSVMRQTRMKH